MKVWNINVRYHMDEDPKILLSTGLALPPGKCYSLLAWGPDGYIAGATSWGFWLGFQDPGGSFLKQTHVCGAEGACGSDCSD